jgi:hypothetical protein
MESKKKPALDQDDILKKLLYSDTSEDKHRMYLNINLLRNLKMYILNRMTPKERGSINCYNLENYLIERALDPSTEDNYKGNYNKYIK